MTSPLHVILVDLDNVLFGRATVGPDACDDWLAASARTQAVDETSQCVVVYAMNLETAGGGQVTFEALDELGHHLSRVVAGSRLLGTELVLTLPVKQSADKALERFLNAAPLAEHAGRLGGVHLLTGDFGLRDSIADQLGAKKYAQARRGPAATSWNLVAKNGRKRRAPSDRTLGFLVAPEHPADPGAAIDTPARALWAQAQSVQVPPVESLPQLVDLLRRRTGLLTQLGPTLTCITGVARLGEVARGGVPVLEPCSPTDGLELCAGDLEQGSYSDPEPSKLGPGAVRFGQPSATARTLLPPQVLLATQGDLRVGRVLTVHDDKALRNASNEALLRGDTFKVKFRRRHDGVSAQVSSGFGTPLPAWWLRGQRSRDKITQELRGMSQQTLSVPAVSEVFEPSGKPALRVRAPLTGPVVAKLKEPLHDGHLGSGSVDGTPVAVLAWEGGQHQGDIRCRPAQEVSETELRRAFPSFQGDFEGLRELPIMVPT